MIESRDRFEILVEQSSLDRLMSDGEIFIRTSGGASFQFVGQIFTQKKQRKVVFSGDINF